MTQNKINIKPVKENEDPTITEAEKESTQESGDTDQPLDEMNLQDIVPAKFINPKTGEINWMALIKSYLALEKKMSSRGQPAVGSFGTRPNSPEEYQIQLKSNLMNIDPEINQRLFELGFTNEQIQAVYDLAAEKVIPMIQELSLDYKADRELADLEKEFGGPERFNTIARQLSSWGEKNLDKSLFDVLASNKEGILALYKMMCNKQESPVLPQQSIQTPVDSEETLRRLMQDPKYWKQQDPELVKRIEDGFKRLYG